MLVFFVGYHKIWDRWQYFLHQSIQKNREWKIYSRKSEGIKKPSSLFENFTNNRLSKFEEKVLFKLVNVGVKFKDVQALSGVNLIIEKGDFTFVTGPSGAGKTTLLNLVSGDVKNFSGSFVKGQVTKKNLFISRVFQNLQIIEDWTALQNIELCYAKEIFNSKREFQREVSDLVNLSLN